MHISLSSSTINRSWAKHIRGVLFYLFLSLCTCAFAQTFTQGRIEYGDGSAHVFSACAIGPNGKFYAIMRDGSFVQSSSNTIPRYHLFRYDGSSTGWTLIHTIVVNTIPNQYVNPIADAYSMLSDNVGMKIDSAGAFHVVINTQLTTTGANIVYAKSTDGTSWTYTPIEANNNATNYTFYDQQIDLDNNSRPHIAFRVSNIGTGGVASRVYTVRHHYYNGSSWVGENVYSQTGGSGTGANEVSGVAFGLDQNGKVHVAFAAETNGSGTDASLFYTTNEGGSWSTPTNLAAGATGAAAVSAVTLVVDSSNKVHIVRRGLLSSSTAPLSYHTNKSGSWVGGQINGSLTGTITFQSLSVNSNSDLLLAYNTATNTGAMRYAYLASGQSTWQTGAIITGTSNTARYPSLAFASNGTAMFLYDNFTGSGSPSYGPPNNPRELDYSTGTIAAPDTTKPTVTSVVRQSPAGQNLANSASSVTFRVTYSEALSATPAAARFAIENVNGGTIAGTIGTPTLVSSGVYDVTVTITSGTGEFRLKVVD